MVFFDWDSTRLSPASLNVLEQARDAFKARQGARVTATGHTDTTGTEAYNMALSLRRANAVKDALVKLGVPAAAITTVGRGEAGLLVQTGDGVREPQNRRVEIVLPPQTAAAPPTNDQAYCAQLARLWRNYDRTTAQGPAPQAIAKCDAGDYASGIPVLEKMLTDAGSRCRRAPDHLNPACAGWRRRPSRKGRLHGVVSGAPLRPVLGLPAHAGLGHTTARH